MRSAVLSVRTRWIPVSAHSELAPMCMKYKINLEFVQIVLCNYKESCDYLPLPPSLPLPPLSLSPLSPSPPSLPLPPLSLSLPIYIPPLFWLGAKNLDNVNFTYYTVLISVYTPSTLAVISTCFWPPSTSSAQHRVQPSTMNSRWRDMWMTSYLPSPEEW